MEKSEYIFVAVVLLLAVSVVSAQLSSDNYTISSEAIVDGIGTTTSDNYASSIAVGLISGSAISDSYVNSLGIFYGVGAASTSINVTISSSGGDNVTSDDIYCNAVIGGASTYDVQVKWYLNGTLNLTLDYSSVASGSFSSILDFLMGSG